MFPNSEWIFKRVITLPLFPTMTIEDVDYVVENIYDILNKNRR
jgi:perosamine synthetase